MQSIKTYGKQVLTVSELILLVDIYFTRLLFVISVHVVLINVKTECVTDSSSRAVISHSLCL